MVIEFRDVVNPEYKNNNKINNKGNILSDAYHFLSDLEDTNSLNPHKNLLVEVTIISTLQIRNVRLRDIR